MRVRRTTSIPANGHCFSSRCVEHLVADSLLAMPGQSPVFLVMVTSSSHPRAEASCALDGSSFATLAQETRKRILRLHSGAGDQAQWKWIENARNFSIYTKQVDGYGVQSSGVIKGCVQEVISLLSSSSQEEFQRKMSAVHGQDFKHGEYVADVAVDSESGEGRGSALSVRRATFARRGWFSRDDEWCYLDETNYSSPRFEKYMTTLSTHDAFISSLHAPTKRDKAVQFRDAVAGFFIQPEDSDRSVGERNCGACVRVHFYAELTSAPRAFLPTFSVPTSKRQAPVSAIQSRLLQIARDCDRLALLVRRRRLGVQVLVNRRSVIPAINGVCIKCERTLVIGKQCRVCGQSVCSDCSEKYERETRVRTRSGEPVHRLEMVRVCDPCLARVESADYAHFNDDARAGSAVVPDPVRKDDISNSAAVDLKALLQDALLNAPSPQRKTAVLSVIRQVLDQEAQDQGDLTPKSRARETKPFCKVTDASVAYATDDETINALDNLALRVIPHDEAPIADKFGRTYPLVRDYTTRFTAPENEEQRVRAILDLHVLSAAPCDELDIVCELAAKEVGVFASIVSIITGDEMRVIAANDPSFKVLATERAHSFCTHTIMDDKPLIISNPEADVRVSYTKVATTLGARFYCGFPILVDGDRVLGSLCCLDQRKHELTESQYTAMNRLASTAARIIEVRGEAYRAKARKDSSKRM